MVTVASRLVESGGAGSAAYVVAKAGVAALTRVLALEYRGRIRFNCVAPGTIDTPDNRKAMPGADRSQWTEPECHRARHRLPALAGLGARDRRLSPRGRALAASVRIAKTAVITSSSAGHHDHGRAPERRRRGRPRHRADAGRIFSAAGEEAALAARAGGEVRGGLGGPEPRRRGGNRGRARLGEASPGVE